MIFLALIGIVFAFFIYRAFFSAVNDLDVIKREALKQTSLLELLARSSGASNEDITKAITELRTEQTELDLAIEAEKEARKNKY